MGPLTAICRPGPRPATLGGEPVEVYEARVRELAELQDVLDAIVPDPLDPVRPALDVAPDAAARRRLLWGAIRAAEAAGHPLYGEPSGDVYFSSDGGICVFLWVALKRGTVPMWAETGRPFTTARVVELARSMTPAEFARIHRLFHGADPLRTLYGMLEAEDDAAPPGRPAPPGQSWGEMIDEMARDRGWTYPQVYDLTISEFRLARREGRSEPAGLYPRATENRAAFEGRVARLTGAGEATDGPGEAPPVLPSRSAPDVPPPGR